MYSLRTAAILLVASGTAAASAGSTSVDNFNYDVIQSEISLSSTPKSQPVTFAATFTNLWTKGRHPFRFPSNNAHWSPMVFVSHSHEYNLWCNGCTASNGLESIAETGSPQILHREISVKQGMNIALDQKTAPGMGTPVDLQDETSPSGNLCVDEDHSLVSSISMIAPSPDWVSGLYDLPLWKGNVWYSKFQAYVYAWDAGTEEGDSYSLENSATNPKEDMSPFMAGNSNDAVFVSENANGSLRVLPVGIITFELKGGTTECTDMSSASNPASADTTNAFYVRVRVKGVVQLFGTSCDKLKLVPKAKNKICRKKARDVNGKPKKIRVRDLCTVTCESV